MLKNVRSFDVSRKLGEAHPEVNRNSKAIRAVHDVDAALLYKTPKVLRYVAIADQVHF